MKFPIFAFFAISLFSLAACQNTPTTPGSTENTANGASAPAPDDASVNVDSLDKHIQYDFYEGRAESYKYTAQYKEAMAFVMSIKQSWTSMSAADQEKVRKLHENLGKFTDAYEIHRQCTDKLEALYTGLEAGTIRPGEAQKEYETVRATMKAEAEKLPIVKSGYDLAAAKAEFDQIFSSANKKAAGQK